MEIFGEGHEAHGYDVHITSHPSCTCVDFAGKIQNKELYFACFIYLRVLGLSQNENMFIH